jgi:LytS/YehU family sensor histidine kinase
MTGLFLFGLFKGYEYFPFLHYSFNDEGFAWAFIAMGIINIFFTFLHEGIARYERWKSNLVETETLKKVYRQTRLQGLKSQINPHFLFNSLNSLSSLIQENQEKGEKFLNEMSKLYRYMLQNDEETLVSLETELRFLDSYIHILRARHNDALKVNLSIREMDKEKLLPPLTLQNIIENSVVQNAVCRECPLEIEISTNEEGYLLIRNNIIPKMVREAEENIPSLNNLIQKYRLLNQREVMIEQDPFNRCISVPLIEKKEEVIA